MSKPPEFPITGRPLVPVAGSYEPAKPGSVRNKPASHVKRKHNVESGSRGIDQSCPDGWKRSGRKGETNER
jgi:hypothetical protein